jgi:hypothetical protein
VHPLSAAQQAAAKQTLNTLSAMSPTFGQAINRLSQREPEEAKPQEAQPMNWNDLLLACAKAPRSGGAVPVPKNILIRGTVLRVDMNSPAASTRWVNIYFRESPDGIFNVCTSSPDIFQDIFGPDFRSSMIGKALEVEGEVTRAYCNGEKGGIRVTLARQVHSVGAPK